MLAWNNNGLKNDDDDDEPYFTQILHTKFVISNEFYAQFCERQPGGGA